ncbi:MAG: RDD family protein [Thermoleophilaceae bacterium]
MAGGAPNPPYGRPGGGIGGESSAPPHHAPPTVFPLPGPPPPVAAPGHGPVTADWGLRVGSAALDYLVKMAVVLPVIALGALGFLASEDVGLVTLVISYTLGILILYAYAPVMLPRDGQTVGNRVTGIRVVRLDGSRISGGRAFVREFLVKAMLFEFVALFATLGIVTLLNYLWPLWDDRGQALHDKIVGTLTVRA